MSLKSQNYLLWVHQLSEEDEIWCLTFFCFISLSVLNLRSSRNQWSLDFLLLISESSNCGINSLRECLFRKLAYLNSCMISSIWTGISPTIFMDSLIPGTRTNLIFLKFGWFLYTLKAVSRALLSGDTNTVWIFSWFAIICESMHCWIPNGLSPNLFIYLILTCISIFSIKISKFIAYFIIIKIFKNLGM